MRVRLVVVSAVLAVTASVLAACGGSGSDANSAADQSTAGDPAASSAFPVTVEHRFGETVVPEEPEEPP